MEVLDVCPHTKSALVIYVQFKVRETVKWYFQNMCVWDWETGGPVTKTQDLQDLPPTPLSNPLMTYCRVKAQQSTVIIGGIFGLKISPHPAPLSWDVNWERKKSPTLIESTAFTSIANMDWLMLQWEHVLCH